MVVEIIEPFGARKAGEKIDVDRSFAIPLIRRGFAVVPGHTPEKKIVHPQPMKPIPETKTRKRKNG